MSLKNDTKFEKINLFFTNNKNLVNIDLSTLKVPQICTLIGPFCEKYVSLT